MSPQRILKTTLSFIKNKPVFFASLFIAACSMMFVPPSEEYIGYINFKTLCQLFCLMAVVEGFKEIGVFSVIGKRLTRSVKSERGLIAALMFLTYVSGMLVTNDVALLTFVPLSITLLKQLKLEKIMIPTVALQTIAANLGSMMMPTGNPHNLYLFGVAEMGAWEFLKLMGPYGIASVLAFAVFIPIRFGKTQIVVPKDNKKPRNLIRKKTLFYSVLFVLCMLSVYGVLDYRIVFGICFLLLLLLARETLFSVDWFLLGTFTAFFIFVGNIKQLGEVTGFLNSITAGHEMTVGIILSQFISNVPSTLLLAGFTSDYPILMVATDIGGLGTLIASMASLISYTFYSRTKKASTSRYILVYSLYCLIFMAVLVALTLLLYPKSF